MSAPAPVDSEEPTLRIVRPDVSAEPLPVLVVSDRADLLHAVIQALHDLRCQTEIACTAEVAQRRVLVQDFGGILLDGRMERHRGQPLLACRSEHNTDLSVILMGDANDGDAIEGGFRVGSGPICHEPARLSQLVASLDRARTDTAHRRVIRRATHLLSGNSSGADTTDIITPPSIRTLQRLSTLLAGEGTDVAEVEAVINRCPLLAATVVRLSGRMRRPGGEPIGNLRQSIEWQGLSRVYELVEMLTARHLFDARHSPIARLMDQMWRFSLTRAEAMRILAERPEVPPRWWFGSVHAAGLFADVGAVFILWLLEQAQPSTGASLSSLEPTLQLIADQHEWMGEDLARRWAMAPEIARLAGNHHPRPNRLHLPFWPLALAASDLADEIVDSPERTLGTSSLAGTAIDALGISAQDRRDLVGVVRTQVDAIREAMEGQDQDGETLFGLSTRSESGVNHVR